MKKISTKEAKSVVGGWTCWACGARGQSKASGLRHAQLNSLHGMFMTY